MQQALSRPTFSVILNFKYVIAIFLGTLVLAVSAKVKVPLEPIPVTLQSLVVLLLGMIGGWRYGLVTVITYLSEGLLGLPVFAVPLGPNFGYLMGFIPAVWIAGYLGERGWCNHVAGCFVTGVMASLAIYVCGVAVLASFIGLQKAFTLGVVPFMLGDCLKVIFASVTVPGYYTLRKRLS